MGIGDFLRNLAGRRRQDEEIRPASEDPYGDPADQETPQNIRPASEDPYGDPADVLADQNIRPASEDPYGDPADQAQGAYPGVRPASEDPHGDPADAGNVYGALQQFLGSTHPSAVEEHVGRQLAGLAPNQADDLAGNLLGLVQQAGVDVNGLLANLGIPPNQAGAYLSQLVGYLHQNHPDALAQAGAQQPGLAALLAHPSLGGVLGSLASQFFGERR